VWRLKALCAPRGADGVEQVSYYNLGLGTTFGEKIRGGLLGHGVGNVVTSAYEWLIDQYNLGDDIFIFGFSRGAYTARSLAGFIAKCGLLKPGSPLGVYQLYGRYRADRRTIYKIIDDRDAGRLQSCSLEEQWMLTYSQPIPIKLVAVWDTVGALGVPTLSLSIPGFSRSSFGFLHTGLRLSIENGFHAVAIDEHRRAFLPTLWTKRTPVGQDVAAVAPPRPLTSVEQRWFVGAHANVGGDAKAIY
jgi:uncharacterized protein (DUF2235 family)